MADFLDYMLAQADPWDESFAPPPPQSAPSRPMTFSDLRGAMHDYTTGNTKDHTFRNGSLVILAVITLIALLIHLRQKQKTAGPPDSLGRLGLELARGVRFPLFSRLLLRWVAASSKVPFASLLLSSSLFDRCVQDWSRAHTFVIVRGWGKGRLDRLRPVLFDQ